MRNSDALRESRLLMIGQVWLVVTDDLGKWMLQLVRRLEHADHLRSGNDPHASAITAICPLDHLIYTGDGSGRVVSTRGRASHEYKR